MGNRVSTLWCKKSNLAIKHSNDESDKSREQNANEIPQGISFKQRDTTKRESKRRFLQRRLSLNCMTRDSGGGERSAEEPVRIHRNSNTLPRRLKLNNETAEEPATTNEEPSAIVTPVNSLQNSEQISDSKSSGFSEISPNSASDLKNSSPPPPPPQISVDEVDGPCKPITSNSADTFKVLTSTKTDLLTREKVTCNVSSTQISRMKFNTDLNNTAKVSRKSLNRD